MPRSTLFLPALLACGLLMAADAHDNTVAEGLNRFSGALYQQVAKEHGGNLVLSPFSISSALPMTLVGARGQTAAEMSKVLSGGPVDPKYHSELAGMIDQIAKAANTGGNQFLNANRVWVQNDFRTLPDFRNILQNEYHAAPALVDFAGAADRVRSEIDAWAERNTQGKIRDLFAPGSLDRSTRLVLSSAVYFYGKWEHPFRPSETRPAPFTLASGTTEHADFMNQTGTFRYAEKPAGQILEMPYASTGLTFDILLPKKGAAVDTIDTAPEALQSWLGSLETRKVQVAVPKFRVESGFPLATTLSSLGMPSAFSGAADFSGIDDRRDLAISEVVHKAYVEINEEGTEAAAATGVGIALVSMLSQPVPVFQADRPFVFVIRDTRTGLILFQGRVMDPRR